MKYNVDIDRIFEYTGKIQKSIFPDTQVMQSFFSEHFLFIKQKYQVGGDFFWTYNIDENIVATALFDVIGKDIRAGFLGMYIINLLNNEMQNFTSGNNALSTKKILESIHKKIWFTFHESETPKFRYGMDACFCIIDKNKKVIMYSGANRSLYKISTGKLTEFKADRISVGWKYPYGKIFIEHTVPFKKSDVFYMFSDGITDQISKDTKKKFSLKRMRNLLIKIHSFDLKSQKKEIEKKFHEYKDNEEQIDDVIVFGMRI